MNNISVGKNDPAQLYNENRGLYIYTTAFSNVSYYVCEQQRFWQTVGMHRLVRALTAGTWDMYHNKDHNLRELIILYANNKGADQPAHVRSLVRAFVIRFPENIIDKYTKC